MIILQPMHRLTLILFLALFIPNASFAEKPNVLFIIVDDLTTTLGCYGNAHVRTPGMDALAARGVRFDRAYTQFALCNPSRCSFLTGCYPEKTGVMDLTTSLRKALPEVVTLPQHFRIHGYATGRVGKVFHVPDPKTKLDVELGSALHRDNEILTEAKAANDPDDKPRTKAKGDGYNRTYAASSRQAVDFTDYAIADDAIATLEQFKEKPFFLAVGFIRPHTPFVAPKAFFEGIDKTKLTLSPFYREGGEDLAQLPNASLRPNNNVFRYAAPTRDEARDALQGYLASTSFVDSQVARVLEKLGELRLAEKTIVVLTGDHGYQLGEHGLWAKQTLFEGANHVPLIISAPGVKPGARSGLAEQVDIYPTLCDLAGLPKPKHLQGRSLKTMLDNPSAKGKQVAISTMIAPHTKQTGHSVRTDAFRYIVWEGGEELLYDLRSDPDELHNLAKVPAQGERIARMRQRLAAHLKAISKR
ncbi:MAG: sulfatase-like hydrolase/transferase [Verrucomicrobiaceae bacterium]|nr:sulfatase-like hydrolase/transferase [Verrucomicrobiaceae bacterium]